MKLIKIGRISGAQGLRGEVKIYHNSGDDKALERLTSLFLIEDGESKQYRINELRMHKRTPIFQLAGVDDRNSAEALVGIDVYADEEESRPIEEDSWLVSDLIGMEVRLYSDEDNHSNSSVYRVKNIISNPAHDILEIEIENEIRMLPFIDVFVKEINTEKSFISISPPEGWLD